MLGKQVFVKDDTNYIVFLMISGVETIFVALGGGGKSPPLPATHC